MTTTKLSLFNGALRELGSRKLASLSENRESRRVLDDIWTSGFVDEVLETAEWTFAMRAIEIASDPSSDPQFGFQYRFTKPSDWVKTSYVCQDEDFNDPCLDYADENDSWWANIATLYIKYVSNDASYGADLSLWTPSVVTFAETLLARKACKRLTQSDSDEDMLWKKLKKAKTEAMSRDAAKGPTKFAPRGKWASSRLGAAARRDTNGNNVS
jgi:hypothetical protein